MEVVKLIFHTNKVIVSVTLEAARNNIGYSQQEAARLLGINLEYLIDLEQDSSNISSENICKISNLYKLPKDFIFFGNKNEYIRILRQK